MYVSTSNSEEIVSAVTEMEMKEGDVAAIFLGEKNRPDVARLISDLNKEGVDFIGGIFPGIIHGDKRYEEGAVMMTMPVLKKPFLIKGLDTEEIELPDFGEVFREDLSTRYTAMILVDGLTSNIDLFLAEMFNQLGNSVHYFGGGSCTVRVQGRMGFSDLGGVMAKKLTYEELEQRVKDLEKRIHSSEQTEDQLPPC